MRILHRLALAAIAFFSIASTSASAQSVCWQENGGPTFNDGFLVGPSAIAAVRVTAAFAFTATGLEFFSGETPGLARVSIWSDDSANTKPLAKLVEQSFTLAAPNGFQGADFHTPLAISAGQVIWVGIALPFTAQSPLDEKKDSLGQIYRTSADNGQSWFGPFQFNTSHYKFRIRGACGPCTGFTTAGGPGCNGILGFPMLSGGGCPTPGHDIVVRIDQGAPASIAILTLGLGTGNGQLVQLCALHNLPLAPLTIPLVLDASGSITLTANLPVGTPSVDFYLQAVIADSAMFYGFSATNVLRLSIG